jgi:hypothetical protein
VWQGRGGEGGIVTGPSLFSINSKEQTQISNFTGRPLHGEHVVAYIQGKKKKRIQKQKDFYHIFLFFPQFSEVSYSRYLHASKKKEQVKSML